MPPRHGTCARAGVVAENASPARTQRAARAPLQRRAVVVSAEARAGHPDKGPAVVDTDGRPFGGCAWTWVGMRAVRACRRVLICPLGRREGSVPMSDPPTPGVESVDARPVSTLGSPMDAEISLRIDGEFRRLTVDTRTTLL